MGSSYPSGLDDLAAGVGGPDDALSDGHVEHHTDMSDAVEAIQGELGVDPSGAATSVAARLGALDTTVGVLTGGSYATDVGDGDNLEYIVTHGLGSEDVLWQVRDNTTGGKVYDAGYVLGPDQIQVVFAEPPSVDAYRVTVGHPGATEYTNPDVTDHGVMSGLADDDHTQYALADGTRGTFADAAQGSKADSAVQPGADATTLGSGAATAGYVLTADGAGDAAWETAPAGGPGGYAPDPSARADGDTLAVNSGALAYVGATVIDAVARGLAKDGTDQAAFLNGLLNEGGRVVIPGGGTVTCAAPLQIGKHHSEFEGIDAPTLKFTQAGHGVVVGDGIESGITPSGYIQGFKIVGPDANAAQTVRSGACGLKLYGMIQHRVEDIFVAGFDIAFDLENNNYGSTFRNIRALFHVNNVGLNLRVGPESGSDLPLYNSWLSGKIAAVYAAGDGGGYHFYGGQASCGGDGGGSAEGVYVLGKDYLSGNTGTLPLFSVEGVDVEGWRGAPAIKTAGMVMASFRDVSFLASQLSGTLATRILDVVNGENGHLEFANCSTQGAYSQASLATVAGAYDDWSLIEHGWSLPQYGVTLAGQSGQQLGSLALQSGISRGLTLDVANGRPFISFGADRLRANNGAVEKSSNGSTWTSVGGTPVVKVTQAAYDALTPDPATLYAIVG